MLKKSFFAFCALMFCTVLTADTAIRTGYNTKAEVAEAFILSLIDQNPSALWQLLPPKTRQELLKENGNNEAQVLGLLKTYITSSLPPAEIAKIKAAIDNPQTREKVLAVMVEQLNKGFVQENGKWYFELSSIVSAKQIDHSSQAGAVEAYLRALAEQNIEVLWQLLAPINRIQLTAGFGGEANAKAFLKEAFFKGMEDSERQRILLFMSDPVSKESFINAAIVSIGKSLIQIDGKWYLFFDQEMGK